MNLLTEPWIPVRSASDSSIITITLKTLLCAREPYVLCLPRDDMEMAACQLLICLVQILWPPADASQLIQRIRDPLSEEEFISGIAGREDDFDLAHPEFPFMQVRGVVAKKNTTMDKLMVGLTGSQNCAFLNQPGQGDNICGGCTAIALFNQASNAPGFGGGFKSGIRGEIPVTTLVQQPCLRTTVWTNVLTQSMLDKHYSGWREEPRHNFTWQRPIISGQRIFAHEIGLARGLFWQPAHIELSSPDSGGKCCACGAIVEQRYSGFLKAKFNYTIEGFWLHPHSPVVHQSKKEILQRRHISFTLPTPCWTQTGRLLLERQLERNQEGRTPALVVVQARQLVNGRRLHLSIGGYRNNQAAILERRHEIMVFNQGWERHPEIVGEIARLGLDYLDALKKALNYFVKGESKKGILGAGVQVNKTVEPRYFQQSNSLITSLLATINYEQPLPQLQILHQRLYSLCHKLFESVTEPYNHHPKLILTLAKSRKLLGEQLSILKTQGEQTDGPLV